MVFFLAYLGSTHRSTRECICSSPVVVSIVVGTRRRTGGFLAQVCRRRRTRLPRRPRHPHSSHLRLLSSKRRRTRLRNLTMTKKYIN